MFTAEEEKENFQFIKLQVLPNVRRRI